MNIKASYAKNQFTQQLSNALNATLTITKDLNRIENKFYLGRMQDYIKTLNNYYNKNLYEWQAAIFNALAKGIDFDYSKKELKVDEMKSIIHFEQAFVYYKEIMILPVLRTGN